MTPSANSGRFEALDGVRATAMLLGVYYHAILFTGMFGGGPPGPMGGGASGMWFQSWLHSFRMPLFFLISGFFCRMMLQKYGLWNYLRRRWSRIAIPLFVGLFTFVPLYHLSMAAFGGGPGGGPPGPGGPPPGTGGRPPGGPGTMDPASMPPPPAGFVPPPLLGFDADGDGSLDEAEWGRARERIAAGGIPGPGIGSGGPGMFGPPGPISERLFGPWIRFFTLSHLWFLWYLLVFATAAPWIARGVAWLARSVHAGHANDWLATSVRLGLAPLLLGLLSVPALMATSGMFGWALGMASAIGRGFPDFLLRLEPDMPFYLAYFLAGWWLHRGRAGLADLARLWLPCLAIGVAAHAVAGGLSGSLAMRSDLAYYPLIRVGGYGLSAIGSAYAVAGFLGFFQRHLDHPSRAGRYAAETAFWVYLVHQPLLAPLLRWIVPLGLPWWLQAFLVSGLATAAALLLYELLVRPTRLVRWFGPGRAVVAAGIAVEAPAGPMPRPGGGLQGELARCIVD